MQIVKCFRSLALFAAALAACQAAPELPVLYEVPAVTLVADDGKPFDVQSLRGHVAIYDFIFTRCPGICPVMSQRMRELYLKTDASLPIRYVSISVDPLNDTPPVLHEYAKKFRRDDRWIFLTGEREAIIRFSVEGFKLAAGEPAAGAEPIVHSSRFVLVDARGMIRGYYDSADAAALTALARDARRLAKEKG